VGKAAIGKKLLLRSDPNWTAFAPPLIIENSEIETMMNRFKESLEQVFATTNGSRVTSTLSKA